MTMLIENIRMAVTSLKANKSRALLTMLGIIIGIASVIAIMTVGNSLTMSVSSSMQSMGANNISVYVQNRDVEEEEREDGIVFGTIQKTKALAEDDLITDEMINGLISEYPDSIEAISINEAVGSTTVKSKDNSASISISGVSRGYFKANEKTMLAGRQFSADESQKKRNVALVSGKFVDELYECDYEEAIGKDITAELGGETVQYTIIGVYEHEDNGMMMVNSGTECFIPLTTAQEFNHSKNYSSFSVVSKVGVNSDDLAKKVESYLQGHYRDNQYFTIMAFSMSSMVSILDDMMGTIVTAISVIAGIALLVGGIGVMNIMLVSITERTREIGTRKALGATNSSIRTQFIVEAMIMCFIGGAIGVATGVGLGSFASSLLGYAASPSASSIVGSLAFSLAIGVFFGYYPANKAAKMNPIDALRYE